MNIPWTSEEEEVFTWEEIKESYKDYFEEMEKGENYDREKKRSKVKETITGRARNII